ncbi:MAG: ribonuclease D [Gemmatimonadetes bacterium]|nr:ribonuclease D [Gemmatimonadota bacterium]|tara:strand:- start:115 stop:1269 length:1155 start_codon:yes stop_codon:yes gene_type:complete
MINIPEELESVCGEAREAGLIGLDTEFVWERTYYPQLGVVQISIGEDRCYLVDTLALDDYRALAGVLESSDVVKILHDSPQDLTILKRLTGASPRNIFDTRIAAGFVGLRASLSLQDLTRFLLNLSLEKTETRTDWLKRPLSDKQVDYAINDVRYLPAMREKLLDRAAKNGRLAWMQQELGELDDATAYDPRDPEEQYTRVKGVGRLSDRDLGTLQSVTAWRERQAEKRDLPRRHVVSDEVLVAVAKIRPKTIGKLRQIRAVQPTVVDRYGHDLLKAVADGADRKLKPLPKPSQSTPHDDVRVEFGLAFVRGRAIDEGVDPALIGSRSDVRDAVLNGSAEQPARLMSGWRREFVGDDLQRVLRGECALRIGGKHGLPKVEGLNA